MRQTVSRAVVRTKRAKISKVQRVTRVEKKEKMAKGASPTKKIRLVSFKIVYNLI